MYKTTTVYNSEMEKRRNIRIGLISNVVLDVDAPGWVVDCFWHGCSALYTVDFAS